MLAVSPVRHMKHRPSVAGDDSEFVIYLRTLTSPERSALTGNHPEMIQAISSGDETTVKTGDLIVAAAMLGVEGWEGLYDDEGNPVEFNKKAKDRLDRLPWMVLFEAGMIVLGMSKASDDDLGNSESGSPKPQDDLPTE